MANRPPNAELAAMAACGSAGHRRTSSAEYGASTDATLGDSDALTLDADADTVRLEAAASSLSPSSVPRALKRATSVADLQNPPPPTRRGRPLRWLKKPCHVFTATALAVTDNAARVLEGPDEDPSSEPRWLSYLGSFIACAGIVAFEVHIVRSPCSGIRGEVCFPFGGMEHYQHKAEREMLAARDGEQRLELAIQGLSLYSVPGAQTGTFGCNEGDSGIGASAEGPDVERDAHSHPEVGKGKCCVAALSEPDDGRRQPSSPTRLFLFLFNSGGSRELDEGILYGPGSSIRTDIVNGSVARTASVDERHDIVDVIIGLSHYLPLHSELVSEHDLYFPCACPGDDLAAIRLYEAVTAQAAVNLAERRHAKEHHNENGVGAEADEADVSEATRRAQRRQLGMRLHLVAQAPHTSSEKYGQCNGKVV
ncbi:hypothetical protein AURDEDRAFT_164640 [Auricularia subglabra TFB-10046 SS5]|nr:hypothetical protein AURDEDRAFT_164640 [Auricularia subglabra TFB-10046 SS5]